MSKFLCICLSATIQKTVNFKNVQLEKVNRSLNYILDASGKAVNSARVLNQIEAGCVSVVCPLGKENSAEFLKLAEKDNLNVFAVETIGRVRECITLLDVENGTTTELVVGEPVTADSYQENEEKLISVVESLIKDVDGVLFAGSRPGIWFYSLHSIYGRKKRKDFHGRLLRGRFTSYYENNNSFNNKDK